jgi:hypothetical protein
MRQDAKDSGRLFDESKLDEHMAIRIDGETKPLSVWRELTDALPVSAGRGATTSAIEQKVESEVQDHIAMRKAQTGQDPLPGEIAQIRKDEWTKVASDEKLSDEAKRLAVEHLKKQIAYLDSQAAHLRDSAGTLTTAQQMFGRSRSTEIARNKVLQNAQTMGSIFDQFETTMDDPHPNGVTDQTLIAEFIRSKHPGSARIGDEESMRIQLAHEGFRNPEAIARAWWTGTALLPEQRQQMHDVLKRAYEAQIGGAEMLLDGYQQELEAQHVPPQIFMLPEMGSKSHPIRPRWAREEDAKAEAAVAAQDAGFAAAEKAAGIQPVAPDSVPGQGTRRQGTTAPAAPTKTTVPTTHGVREMLHNVNPFHRQAETAKTGPAQLNEERIINGERARWDGKNWVTF